MYCDPALTRSEKGRTKKGRKKERSTPAQGISMLIICDTKKIRKRRYPRKKKKKKGYPLLAVRICGVEW